MSKISNTLLLTKVSVSENICCIFAIQLWKESLENHPPPPTINTCTTHI